MSSHTKFRLIAWPLTTAAIVALIGLSIFLGSHHTTKAERISKLEQQVAQLQAERCP